MTATHRTRRIRGTSFLLLIGLLAGTFFVQTEFGPTAWGSTHCPPGAPNATRPPGKAARITDRLYSCPDGSIRNIRGRKIRLMGLEYFKLGWGSEGAGACDYAWTPLVDGAQRSIYNWGFNSVELFFSWQNLEPTPPTYNPATGGLTHHYDPVFLAALDSAVHRLTKKGIAVVLAMMQARWSSAFQHIWTAEGTQYNCGLGMPAWIYELTDSAAGDGGDMVQAEVRFFQGKQVIHDPTGQGSEGMQHAFFHMWQFLVRHYRKNHKVVGALPLFESYDILTRTYEGADQVTPKTLNLAAFLERAAKAIHRVNPSLLIMFTEQKSHTTGKWSLTRRPRIPNGVVTAEFYAGRWSTDGRRRMKQYMARAHGWNYPLYIDEFDAFGMGRNRPKPWWATSTRDMLAFERRHQISWTFNSFGQGGFQLPGSLTEPKPLLWKVLRRGF